MKPAKIVVPYFIFTSRHDSSAPHCARVTIVGIGTTAPCGETFVFGSFGVGVGVGVGVTDGVGETVGVGVTVGDAVGEAVGAGVAVELLLGVGDEPAERCVADESLRTDLINARSESVMRESIRVRRMSLGTWRGSPMYFTETPSEGAVSNGSVPLRVSASTSDESCP